jgi:hypothetical protein
MIPHPKNPPSPKKYLGGIKKSLFHIILILKKIEKGKRYQNE